MKPFFAYKPKSGDKCIASKVVPCGPSWVEYENGCRHVFGGVRLVYMAADPGRWWRDDATTAAGKIVQAAGGIAFDECGMVSLIVPVVQAARAWSLMQAAAVAAGGSIQDKDRDANLMALALAGAADIVCRETAPHLGPQLRVEARGGCVDASELEVRFDRIERQGDANDETGFPASVDEDRWFYIYRYRHHADGPWEQVEQSAPWQPAALYSYRLCWRLGPGAEYEDSEKREAAGMKGDEPDAQEWAKGTLLFHQAGDTIERAAREGCSMISGSLIESAS